MSVLIFYAQMKELIRRKDALITSNETKIKEQDREIKELKNKNDSRDKIINELNKAIIDIHSISHNIGDPEKDLSDIHKICHDFC